MDKIKYKDIDTYIAVFPKETQVLLEQLRSAIHEAAPEATEAISYQIPTFKQQGNLVHFAGYKNHIGFYPGALAITVFEKELVGYEISKGTVRFPLTEPLPLAIIRRIVEFRILKNREKPGVNK